MSSTTTGKKRPIELLLEFSVPLIAGVVTAVAWANIAPHSYHALIHWSPFGEGSHFTVHFLVNDIFMVLFFGVAAKEITEACLPGGALNPPSRAINPVLSTLGGVLGPVAVYFIWLTITNDWGIANGWGIPTATDIALAWLVARMAFGSHHPAVSFLLLLAVADDGIGLAIIAIFYPDPVHPVQPMFLLLVASAILLAWGLRRAQVKNFWFYLAGPGVMSWFGLHLAHLHPALALVAVIPFMPTMGFDEGLYAEESVVSHVHTDTLNTFEHTFKTFVDIGLFGFGLANAGVAFSAVGNPTWAVLLSLLIGKTVGIVTFGGIGHLIGFRLPTGMDGRTLLVAGMTAALGLTVALFVAGQAFVAGPIQDAAKMGALFSAGVAPVVLITSRVLAVKRRTGEATHAAAKDSRVALTEDTAVADWP